MTAVNEGTRSAQAPMFVEILILLGLLGLSAFFSGSETAIFALSDLELSKLAKGTRAQQKAVDLARHPGRTLVTVLLANMIVNVVLSVLITSMALRAHGPSGLALAIPVATVVLLLFGEIIPKSMGLRRRRPLAEFSALPLSVLARALGPVRVGLERVAHLVVGNARPEPLKRAELPTLVSLAAEDGQISPFESRVMRRVLRFADTPIARCFTPRVEMVALPASVTVGEALEAFARSGRSRIPLFEDGPDQIVGVLLQKDLLTRDTGSPGDAARAWMRPVAHVPESVTADELFRRFQRDRVHLAIVVEERGGVEGVVTMEDLLEELVGDIRDESDEGPAGLERLEDGSWRGSASLEISEVAEYLDLPDEGFGEAVTLSGVLQAELGRVPVSGDEIVWRGWRVRVLTASPTRARLVRLYPQPGGDA